MRLLAVAPPGRGRRCLALRASPARSELPSLTNVPLLAAGGARDSKRAGDATQGDERPLDDVEVDPRHPEGIRKATRLGAVDDNAATELDPAPVQLPRVVRRETLLDDEIARTRTRIEEGERPRGELTRIRARAPRTLKREALDLIRPEPWPAASVAARREMPGGHEPTYRPR
jgi:hypothetical protein